MPEDNSKTSRPLPDDAYQSLVLILSYADKLSKICESVEQTNNFLSMRKLAEAVAEKTGIAEEEAFDIVGSLIAFQNLRNQLNLDVDGFIEWLSEPLVDFAHEEGKEVEAEAWQKELTRIKEVFDEDSAFGVMSKAIELVYAHQNALIDARLLTDLRPVYDKQAKKMLRMVVTHQLVLKYSEENSEKKIYLAVDASDLEKLEKECKRARDKANVVSESMKDLDWATCIVGENNEE